MKWEEVRKIYPNKFVKLQILQFHLDGNAKIIDDMAVIKVIDDNKEATKELMHCKNGTTVYNTANKNISIEIKNIRAYRNVLIKLEANINLKKLMLEL